MKKRLILSLVLMATMALVPLSMAQSGVLAVPVAGTFTDTSGGIGHFVGSFNIQNFVTSGSGAIVAVGTLVGTLTNSTGALVGTITRGQLTLPITIPSASCSILNLTLGPLDVNLLGLVVHLNQVHLTITAQSGPGNLLGNLLCAVANALNNTSTLVTLLNKILLVLG